MSNLPQNQLQNRGVEFLRSTPIPQVKLEGFENMSWQIGNFRTQQINLFVAETGFGKSDLAVDWSLRLAKSKVPVLFFSAEMTLQAVLPRFMANASEIDRSDSLKLHQEYHESTDEVKQSFEMAIIEKLEEYDLKLEFDRNIEEILAKVIQHKEKFGTQFVFIDHILFLTSSVQFSDETKKIDYIFEEMFKVAQEYNICFICATQFNKQSERGAEFGKRSLGEVAGGRAVSHIVENVLYLFESEEDKDANEKNKEAYKTGYRVSIKTLKKRNGVGGITKLIYYKNRCRFYETPNQKPHYAI